MKKNLIYGGLFVAGAVTLYFFGYAFELQACCAYPGNKDFTDFLGPIVSFLAVLTALGIATSNTVELRNAQKSELARIDIEKIQKEIQIINAIRMELLSINAMCEVWKKDVVKETAEKFNTEVFHLPIRCAYEYMTINLLKVSLKTMEIVFINEPGLQENLHAMEWLKKEQFRETDKVIRVCNAIISTTSTYQTELEERRHIVNEELP